jgi:predicted O-methyltransferase YrrM
VLTLAGAPPPVRRGRVRRALEFVVPFAVAGAGVLYLFTLGLARRRDRGTIVELARRFGHAHDRREPTELPLAAADALVPPGTLVDLREVEAVDGNVSERELVAICRLTRALAPHRVFELGTFDGRTTLNLAANAPDARVFTLDLPRSGLGSTAGTIEASERQYADKEASGTRFAGSAEAARITQLYGDSATFDYAPYEGTMDLVFIDASHAYEYVLNDSLRALRLLRPSGGVVLWHDYGRWDGVTRALNALRRLEPRCATLRWIAGTTLALLRVPPAGDRLQPTR